MASQCLYRHLAYTGWLSLDQQRGLQAALGSFIKVGSTNFQERGRSRQTIVGELYGHKSRQQQLSMSILIALLLLSSCSLFQAKMSIQAPQQLATYFNDKYKGQGIPYSIANYGVVPYSKTVSGAIGIPSVLEDCLFQDLSDQTASKPILLLQRNDCTFTQKSLNAQKEGAKMAIIMDTRLEDPGAVVMMDDGRGTQVTIPTLLISRQDGLKILQALSTQNVVTSVSFEVPTRSQSELQLWLDISEHSNFVFLREFQPYYKKLKGYVNLQVAYPTRKCPGDYCKDTDCYYNMSYCRIDYKFMGVENRGQLIIKEQLRQYYVFQLYPSQWWDYVLLYDETCIDLADVESCSAKIMKKLEISQAEVGKAVEASFQGDDNALLRQLSERKYNSSIVYFPSVVVNSMVYRGNLEPFEVYELICDSLTPQPQGCSGYTAQDNPVTTWIGFIVVGILAFAVFLIICFRRVARRQVASKINQQVNELVNQYITMYENERFENGAELATRRPKPTGA